MAALRRNLGDDWITRLFPNPAFLIFTQIVEMDVDSFGQGKFFVACVILFRRDVNIYIIIMYYIALYVINI